MGQKRLLFRVFALAIGPLLGPAYLHARDARGYEMADLEVLVKENNTREFLAHAHDIRPSERDKRWREMVSQMALLALKEAQSFRPISELSFDHIQSIASWPVLKADDYFTLKRVDFTKTYLSDCFELNKAPEALKKCLPRARKYVATTAANPNFDHFLVTKLKEKFPTTPAAVKDFKLALIRQITHGEFAAEFCARKDIQAILREVALEKAQHELRQNPKAPSLDLSALAPVACLKPMALGTELDPSSQDLPRSSAIYLILRSLGLLQTQERDYFLTYYLLSGPTQGELFNLAWNNLKSLATDSERRAQVLGRLKAHSRAPDESFGSPDVRLRRTLSEAFLTYFPEYTDYYIKECHRYLSGEGNYPRGNPTRYCDDLILISRMKGTLSDEVFLRHSALKKFRPIK